MGNFKKLYFSPFFYVCFLLTALIYGCASMSSPQGGPIDKTPPRVLKMEPENFTKNFKAQKIIITFDEYFNLRNELQEFSISPEQEKAPLLKKSQKKLEIIFQDTLEKNTTYTLNFGKAIADVNEGNVIKNLTYTFSTGPKLDSLSIKGRVINTLTGKPELDAIVFILPLEKDSLLGKKRPGIFTSTDSSGNFSLQNLREDTYKIYALKEDKGGDKIYQQQSDEIAFLKDSIVLNKNVDNILLGLFKEDPKKFRVLDRKLNPDGSISMIFNQKLKSPAISVLDNVELDSKKLIKFNKTNDSLRIWLKDMGFDTVKLVVKSEGKTLDTVTFGRDKKDTYSRTLLINDNLSGGGVLNPYQTLKLYFNFPIEKADISKIKLKEDTLSVQNFTLEKDSTDFLTYRFNYAWKKKKNYTLTIEENAFTGIFDTKNKNIRKLITLGDPDDYGTYTLSIKVPDTSINYIVELLNEQKKVVASNLVTKNNTSVVYSNFKVGTYYSRVIYDVNKNGKWDTGNLGLRTQPEKTWNNPQELVIRANWQLKMTYEIPPPPEEKIATDKKENSNEKTEGLKQ